MVKREAIWLVALLVIVLFGATIASASADIAYIYRKTFKIDDNILDVFDSYNLTYDLIDERDLPVNFGQYKLIFVGDENFRNENRILVNQFPSIVANYYHADYWGLSDSEGVSQLGSDSPLSVKQGGRMIQVYTQGRKWPGGPSVVYYYLDEENKAQSLETVALTETTSSGETFGDVIAYASPGDQLLRGITQQAKMCFFGIVESDYWTPAAQSLFEDCLGYVGAECEINDDCPEPEFDDPFCQAGDVYRNVTYYTCQENGAFKECVPEVVTEFVEDCAYDCEAGQCIGECETDSDCGTSGPVSDLFCIGLNVSQTFEQNTCVGAGTPNAHCVFEIVNQTNETCEDICIDGACQDILCFNNADCDDGNSSTEDTCIFPGTIDSFCTNLPIECFNDFDCGTPGFVGDPFCTATNVTKIFESYTCQNPGTAASFCSSNQEQRTIQECADLCINGECAGITCTMDSDCDDFDPLTLDECINPGTVQSECRNTPINCASNSDCGFTGFMGEEFCSGLSVMKTFQNATCFNPGTLDSYCTVNQQDKVLEQCDQVCVDGSCLDVVCTMDSDCDDFDPLTLDECINPGTVQSRCENTEINCASDDDCGFTGYLGAEYCSTANNVSKNFQSANCINPGTTLSFCDLSVFQEFINECEYACYDGGCIRCDENLDCDDGNPNTVDLCFNPDTPASYCSYEGPQGNVTCFEDSDCGDDNPIGNPFCVGQDISQLVQTWMCNNPGTTQSYCSSNPIVEVLESCTNYCLDGECTDIECFNNADCDDSDPQTADICNNPGTPESFCTNEPIQGNITCSQDSDCGVDTPLSPLFCTDDDVTQLIQTWACLNPDTQQSYCSSDVIVDTIEDCPEFCLDGECVDIECFTNQDCNDGNSTTVDICNNPGTPESFCTNNPIEIACFDDDDCGPDGFVGNPFCVGLDVTKLFQEFDCNHPGTPQSFCSISVSDVVLEQCDFDCDDGQCVPEQGECTPGEIRPCGSDVGECRAGINVCFMDSTWSQQCFGEITPVVEICDGKDNDCDGQVDEGGVCGPGCSDECVDGERACDGNGYRICGDYDADECTEWSTRTQCSFGQVCIDGYCVESCQDECSYAGQRICSGNGYIICGQFDSDSCLDWSSPTQCGPDEVCESGYCVPDQTCQDDCTYGDRECSGNGFRICGNFDSDSCAEWSTVSQCSFGEICIDGFCIIDEPSCENECTQGEQVCDGNGYRICGDFDSDECTEWSTRTQCSTGEVCINGECIIGQPDCEDDCTYGDRQCDGNGYRICGNFDSDSCAEWSTRTQCSYGQVCISGQCI